MTIKESDFYQLYRGRYVPVFADYVALGRVKPEQALVEESNILAHLCQQNNPALSIPVQQENLKKAYNHLVRVTLDLHKLVWVEIDRTIGPFVKDSGACLCFNKPRHDVLKLYANFVDLAMVARRHELEHIGNDPLSTIKLYENVNAIGVELHFALDGGKVSEFSRWKIIFKSKEFILALLTSIIVTAFVTAMFCPSTYESIFLLFGKHVSIEKNDPPASPAIQSSLKKSNSQN